MRTHLAVSYFDRENAFHNMDEADVKKSGVWEFIDWLREERSLPFLPGFPNSCLLIMKRDRLSENRKHTVSSENGENRDFFTCPEV